MALGGLADVPFVPTTIEMTMTGTMMTVDGDDGARLNDDDDGDG